MSVEVRAGFLGCAPKCPASRSVNVRKGPRGLQIPSVPWAVVLGLELRPQTPWVSWGLTGVSREGEASGQKNHEEA